MKSENVNIFIFGFSKKLKSEKFKYGFFEKKLKSENVNIFVFGNIEKLKSEKFKYGFFEKNEI